MGQTSSHKHMRSEYLKNPNYNQQVLLNNMSHGGINPSNIDYNYQNEDLIDDEEVSCPTINSKYSYSPSESIPTFPNRNSSFGTEPIAIQSKFQENTANKKIPVVFKYNKVAKEIYLIGSFTSWKDKIAMVKSDGDFVAIVDLPEGEHQYKFVVDGRWEHDPNQATIDDNFSGKNNIVLVKKSDFEVMDALAMDSIQNSSQKQFQCNDDLSKSPPGEYTDEVPVRGLTTLSIDKPPYLPPQLLNIVLNKDTAVRCEPTLLPEPNHVMLKHLYALSIRDGVMVLSSTFRYKQKFVTTCFYKPI